MSAQLARLAAVDTMVAIMPRFGTELSVSSLTRKRPVAGCPC